MPLVNASTAMMTALSVLMLKLARLVIWDLILSLMSHLVPNTAVMNPSQNATGVSTWNTTKAPWKMFACLALTTVISATMQTLVTSVMKVSLFLLLMDPTLSKLANKLNHRLVILVSISITTPTTVNSVQKAAMTALSLTSATNAIKALPLRPLLTSLKPGAIPLPLAMLVNSSTKIMSVKIALMAVPIATVPLNAMLALTASSCSRRILILQLEKSTLSANLPALALKVSTKTLMVSVSLAWITVLSVLTLTLARSVLKDSNSLTVFASRQLLLVMMVCTLTTTLTSVLFALMAACTALVTTSVMSAILTSNCKSLTTNLRLGVNL
mmetsp:Transcript_26462/g.36135  ORF Transcript_26462/g.36135 Transcript_26462/m.36135 type:complete len:327 (-) Transcript_26462:505-1485(-)